MKAEGFGQNIFVRPLRMQMCVLPGSTLKIFIYHLLSSSMTLQFVLQQPHSRK